MTAAENGENNVEVVLLMRKKAGDLRKLKGLAGLSMPRIKELGAFQPRRKTSTLFGIKMGVYEYLLSRIHREELPS